jgi:hypothetical protein
LSDPSTTTLLLPALPGASPVQILGTNKLGGICGTTVSRGRALLGTHIAGDPGESRMRPVGVGG